MKKQFKEGDEVRTTADINGIPAGTTGVVITDFLSCDMVEVEFEFRRQGETVLSGILIHPRHLEAC